MADTGMGEAEGRASHSIVVLDPIAGLWYTQEVTRATARKETRVRREVRPTDRESVALSSDRRLWELIDCSILSGKGKRTRLEDLPD